VGADANGDQGVVSANTEKAPLGESWFDEEQRIHATRDALREVLGVSLEWNPFDELWALDLPPGQRITGLVSKVARQPYSQESKQGNATHRMLIGQATQTYFPVKNPLWIRRHSSLR